MTLAGILGVQEILITIIIILVLTGGAFLPRLMRNMGRKVKEFEDQAKDSDDKMNEAIDDILIKQKRNRTE